MSKTLLIHGYAADLTAWKFRRAFGEHAGFVAFDQMIESGKAVMFRWGIDRKLSFWQSLNPFSYLKLYRNEEALAESIVFQQNLIDFIVKNNIDQIICHSMGCRLLLSTINVFDLPASIKQIIFLQADFPTDSSMTHPDLLNRISITNYFCPWDQSLLASSMLHKNLRAGLVGWRQPSITNRLYPLLKPINLHTSPLRDKLLAETLLNT
jgi:hypothetical protein